MNKNDDYFNKFNQRVSLKTILPFLLFSYLSSSINAQVVINEVNVKPGTSSTSAQFQSMKDCANPTYGSEYVELYNKNPCTAIDISCYIVATPYSGLVTASQGSFRFPVGTIIPPLGFISIGGANSGATFLLPNYCTGANSAYLNTGAARWFLDNFEESVGLYDASGNVLDVVYWTTNTGQANLWNNASYPGLATAASPVANPAACNNVVALAAPSTFPASVVSYAGASPNMGTVICRVQDGSATWVTNAAATLNACNGTCIVATPFNISASVTQPTCAGNNGAITITPTPAGAYTYTWSPNVSTTNSVSSLSAASYSITVSSGGCQKDTTITLASTNGPTNIIVTPVNTTCGLSNGSVTLGAVTGGTAPYTYNFNGLGYSATTSFTNLASGTYTLLVKDSAGCIYTATNITINPSTSPTAIAVTPTNATCGQSDGAVTLGAVTGGTASYTFNFNGLGYSATNSYTSLQSGNYTLIVKDAAGCTYTAPNIALNSANGPTAITVTPTNPTCGQSDGAVTLGAVTGGNAPYTYNFNGLGYSVTTSHTSLSSGNYTLIVKDAAGCTYTAPNIALNSANGPTAITITPTNTTCGQTNGAVTLGAVTGGTAPYTYNFNNLGYSATTSYTSLVSGSYTFMVQDATGCTYTAPNIVLTDAAGPTSIAVAPTNPTCGQSNGSVTLGTVTGGTAPYTYNFNGLGYSTTTSYSNLASGNYTLTIQDNNGCTYTAPSITLNASNGPSAIIVTPTNSTCGQLNSSVTLGAVTGGTAPYTYNFNSLGYSASTNYSNLAAGNYTLTVKDNNGCTYSTTVNIQTSTGPTSAQITPVSAICALSNGSITIANVVGGTAPYQYNFNNLGLSTNTFYPNIAAGTYPVVITDNNGCSITLQATVGINNSSGPSAATYAFITPDCGTTNGTVEILTVVGGTPPYSYNFNNTFFGTNTIFGGLSAGNYPLVIVDTNGCILNDLVHLLPGFGEETVYAPNSFTPNGDLTNDDWYIKGYCIKDLNCNIFNRWGENIAKLDLTNNKWDGKYMNRLVELGVYVYVADVTFQSGITKRIYGKITLVN